MVAIPQKGIFIMDIKTIGYSKSKKSSYPLIIAIIALNLIAAFGPEIGIIKAYSFNNSDQNQAKDLAVIEDNSLTSVSSPSLASVYPSLSYLTSSSTKRMEVKLTAYSSTPEQTDDTPFTTASGKMVRDGIVANNLLPFGTKFKIPALYGEKIFEVQDRMHSRKPGSQIDIWFDNTQSAKNFGVKYTYIEIIEDI